MTLRFGRLRLFQNNKCCLVPSTRRPDTAYFDFVIDLIASDSV